MDSLDQAQLMYFPPTQQPQNQELALFFMGMFQRTVQVGFETLNSILQGLIAEQVPKD